MTIGKILACVDSWLVLNFHSLKGKKRSDWCGSGVVSTQSLVFAHASLNLPTAIPAGASTQGSNSCYSAVLWCFMTLYTDTDAPFSLNDVGSFDTCFFKRLKSRTPIVSAWLHEFQKFDLASSHAGCFVERSSFAHLHHTQLNKSMNMMENKHHFH